MFFYIQVMLLNASMTILQLVSLYHDQWVIKPFFYLYTFYSLVLGGIITCLQVFAFIYRIVQEQRELKINAE